MYFHIILTEECNSRCKYCFEKSMNESGKKMEEKFSLNFSAPCQSSVDIQELKDFISKDPDPKIIFYGGEPLLNSQKIIEIMDSMPEAKFYMQTNGKLFRRLPSKYTNKLQRILISIDGNQQTTDFNRGKGTYEIVLKNIDYIRKNGYKGELVARMTLSFSYRFPGLLEQVKHLLELGFDSIHWQLDMGLFESDYNYQKVQGFIEKYNPEVSALLDFWIEEMKKGKVLKIYPFLGLFESLYKNEPSKLRCGSGYANYTITTDGKIVACPIMNGIEDFCVGNINQSNPLNLKEISVGEPCLSCSYYGLCGGRCLYSNKTKLWPPEGEEQICGTIKYFIDSIKSRMPKIKSLIQKEIIKPEQFEFEKYFGPEIIP